jgi:hypothetical protein
VNSGLVEAREDARPHSSLGRHLEPLLNQIGLTAES